MGDSATGLGALGTRAGEDDLRPNEVTSVARSDLELLRDGVSGRDGLWLERDHVEDWRRTALLIRVRKEGRVAGGCGLEFGLGLGLDMMGRSFK
jgi:hypothetical protein